MKQREAIAAFNSNNNSNSSSSSRNGHYRGGGGAGTSNRTMAALLRPNPAGRGPTAASSSATPSGSNSGMSNNSGNNNKFRAAASSSSFRWAFSVSALVAIAYCWTMNLWFIRQQDQHQEEHYQLRQEQQQQRQQSSSAALVSRTTTAGGTGATNTAGGGIPGSPPRPSNGSGSRYHVVFSTGCTPYQDWQSYAFFYHVLTSGQEGDVTRVASGCTPEEAETMQRTFEAEIVQGMLGETTAGKPPRFHLHHTPNFAATAIEGTTYKFFNKPMGLRHWMDHGLQYGSNRAAYDDVVFIILDPDEFIIRPFVQDYGPLKEVWHQPSNLLHVAVSHGHAMSQLYGLGARWSGRINMTQILGNNSTAPSPVRNWTKDDINSYYVAGPPYIATGKDMFQIVQTWADFVVPVYKQTTDFLSEMYAYSVAAGHLGLPHQLARSFMVSHTDAGNLEGWPLIDIDNYNDESRNNNNNTYAAAIQSNEVPHVLHFCQRFHLGPYFFAKYSVPLKFLTCEHPLFDVPHYNDRNITACIEEVRQYEYEIMPPEKWNLPPTKVAVPPRKRTRHAFGLCHLLTGMNDAAVHYKKRHCANNVNASYATTYVWPHTTRADIKEISV